MKLSDNTKIIVIGAGGTGSMLILPLARYLRAKEFVGELIIADGDKYEPHNAERQAFALSKSGMNKAEYQGLAIGSQLPDFTKRVSIASKYLAREDVESLISDNTIVINCADNLAIRKYVEDRVASLDDAVHICCGNDLRYGQVQVYVRQNGQDITPSIYKQSPDFNQDLGDRSQLNCEQLAELDTGGQLICANMMAAAIALSYVVQLTGDNRVNQNGKYVKFGSIFYDCLTQSFKGEDEQNIESMEAATF